MAPTAFRLEPNDTSARIGGQAKTNTTGGGTPRLGLRQARLLKVGGSDNREYADSYRTKSMLHGRRGLPEGRFCPRV